jgi:hypothetical protein
MATKSARAERRAALIKQGKCGTCGKRKLSKGHKECRTCLDYYAAWAKTKREVENERRERRNAQKRAWRAKQKQK